MSKYPHKQRKETFDKEEEYKGWIKLYDPTAFNKLINKLWEKYGRIEITKCIFDLTNVLLVIDNVIGK